MEKLDLRDYEKKVEQKVEDAISNKLNLVIWITSGFVLAVIVLAVVATQML